MGSLGSMGSFGSIVSLGSLRSFGFLGSLRSSGSLGSQGSLGSLGSFGSLGSLGSWGSLEPEAFNGGGTGSGARSNAGGGSRNGVRKKSAVKFKIIFFQFLELKSDNSCSGMIYEKQDHLEWFLMVQTEHNKETE
ncbi:hypothetical protein B9Z55_017070 [Caenorhabditis nigoni]|uniref:Uncharacterized protein n=1 Tax=Caenorhabditis nigoni TaxID=1611254 RepID=A0A2G5T8D4_9PELO|nr:hypothetical protein B9Z55_017070 [Caenorhabditis nigoni]